jgi:hypothetical protein
MAGFNCSIPISRIPTGSEAKRPDANSERLLNWQGDRCCYSSSCNHTAERTDFRIALRMLRRNRRFVAGFISWPLAIRTFLPRGGGCGRPGSSAPVGAPGPVGARGRASRVDREEGPLRQRLGRFPWGLGGPESGSAMLRTRQLAAPAGEPCRSTLKKPRFEPYHSETGEPSRRCRRGPPNWLEKGKPVKLPSAKQPPRPQASRTGGISTSEGRRSCLDTLKPATRSPQLNARSRNLSPALQKRLLAQRRP